jgi:phosphate transport system permease protein
MVIGGTNLIPASVFSSGQTLPSLLVNTFGEMMSLPLTQSALIFVALILLIVVTAFNILATVTRKNFERKWRY